MLREVQAKRSAFSGGGASPAALPPRSPLLLDAPPLLLGSGGMLHRAWHELLNEFDVAHRSFGRRELDLARPEAVNDALPHDCRLVINCAAYTDVDGAEEQEDVATAVNGTGVGALAQACARRGSVLVHYSTDYVFDGKGTRPYVPEDPRSPIGAYGRSKTLGEELVESSGCRYLLIRTSRLYAPWGRNFVRTIATFARDCRPMQIVNDQRGRPTSAEHLATATLGLIGNGARGTYHVTDGGECTWFEFAVNVARLVNAACSIKPITTAELGRPAKRPAYSVLDLAKTEALLGPMAPWERSVADVVSRLE